MAGSQSLGTSRLPDWQKGPQEHYELQKREDNLVKKNVLFQLGNDCIAGGPFDVMLS